MKRLVLFLVILFILFLAGLFLFNRYWIHRYDALIARQARVYSLDPDLVWSVIYEETYFRPWKTGEDAEIGLMQVTPTVGREWASETGMRELEKQMARDPESVLRDPERNIQVGCWYLEKIFKDYRDTPYPEARMVAAYNAGPSRAVEWNRTQQGAPPLTAEEFISRIDIASTRAYVSNIIARYRKIKARRQTEQRSERRTLRSAPATQEPVLGGAERGAAEAGEGRCLSPVERERRCDAAPLFVAHVLPPSPHGVRR